MFKYRSLCQWSLDRFFHGLTCVLVIIGFSMLVLAEQLSPAVLLLFLLFFCGSFSSRVSQRFQLTVGRANFLTWLYLPLFLADMFFFSRSFVPATLHLILFVQLVKIYQAKGNRDYFYLILLSFLQVLAASSLTINISFFAGFLVFVFVSLAALMGFEMKRALEASISRSEDLAIGGEDARVQQPAELELGLAEQGRAIRAILLFSLVSLCAISLLGAALFFAVPRFGAGYFSRTMSKTLSLSGFSDRIQLGSIGMIQLDPSIVMRVKVSGNRELFDGLKWRGVTLDHFDGRTWSKRVKGPAYSFPPGQVFKIREPASMGTLVKYQVMLEPCSTYYLFTLNRILTLRGNLYPFIYDPFDDSITARPHPFYRLTYQADSVLSQPNDPEKADLSFAAKPAYLQLPGLDKRIFELARKVAFGAQSLEEKANKIEEHLQTNYSYSLEPWQVEQPQPLATFLFESKKGHCEYFASAMVIMLRTLGIPSRIVNGFRASEYNDIGGDYIIRGKDAHSWVEAHCWEHGWQTYDPTPASIQTTPQHPLFTTINNYLDAFELFWGEWILGYDEVTQISLLRDLQEKSSRWADQSQRQFYNAALGIQETLLVGSRKVMGFARQAGWKFPTLCAFIGMGGWSALRLYYWLKRELLVKKAIRKSDGTLAVQFYGEMLKFFRSKGKAKPQNLTPKEFVETFANQLLRREVKRLTWIYNEMRFSKSALSKNQIQQAYWILSGIRKLSKKGKVVF
jgi:hypothetical protein